MSEVRPRLLEDVPPLDQRYPYAYPYPIDEDDISLVDLWRVLAERRQLILIVTAVACAMGLAYSLLASPVYRAKSFVLPPLPQNIQLLDSEGANLRRLDLGELELTELTTEGVFQGFLRNLKSRGLRREFFDQEKLLEYFRGEAEVDGKKVYEIFDEQFNDRFAVNEPSVNEDLRFVSVWLDMEDPELAANLLNKFVELAQTRTVQQLYGNVDIQIRTRIRSLRETIQRKRSVAEQNVADKIVVLEEAARIAASLGLKEGADTASVPAGGRLGISVNTVEIPLYTRGENALRAEIRELRARTTNDPFIEDLRDRQNELSYLESVKIDRARLRAATIDERADPPDERLKPNRTLIMLLSLVGGLMLGIFAAFIANFIQKQRQQLATVDARQS